MVEPHTFEANVSLRLSNLSFIFKTLYLMALWRTRGHAVFEGGADNEPPSGATQPEGNGIGGRGRGRGRAGGRGGRGTAGQTGRGEGGVPPGQAPAASAHQPQSDECDIASLLAAARANLNNGEVTAPESES